MLKWRIWFSAALTAFSIVGLMTLTVPASEESVPSWLSRVKVGGPTVYRNLALYPISGPERHLPPRMTLDGALRENVLHVQELNEGGSVNQLTVENSGGRAVFIMAGEILSGARQDRVLQHDLWLPAHSGKVSINVYCVEHGRWTYKTSNKSFDSKSTLSNTAVRAAAQLDQNQGAVWKSVDETNRASGVSAPTQSLNSAYEDVRIAPQVDEYARHFEDMLEEHPEMCGVVVQVGNRFTAIDMFPDRRLLQALWPKLTRSYALEARGGSRYEERRIPTDLERAQSYLDESQNVESHEIPHVGEGELLALSSRRFGGEALVLEEGPAHIDLFSRSRGSYPTPDPQPTLRPRPSPWPPAQELIRPHHED